MKTFDLNIINQLVAEGKLSKQVHPTEPLSIYKYTAEAQFSRSWDEVLLQCRGLVLDDKGIAYTNPIPKFFNVEELNTLGIEIPALPYEITDKVDGSCIEVFWYENRLVVCTLGSFTSDQAKLAQQLLYTKYGQNAADIMIGETWIFELIHPSNRIVLDYGTESKLVLIAVRNGNGMELSHNNMKRLWPDVVEKIDKTLEELLIEKKREDFTNKEGFVVKFTNGLRIKVKYEEYFRLHKIMTGVNEKFIWEFLREGKPLPLENVPDEFFQYVTEVRDRLLADYAAVELSAKNTFEEINVPGISRKDFALQALKRPYSAVLFKMLTGQVYTDIIWKIIEPKSSETKKFNSFRGES